MVEDVEALPASPLVVAEGTPLLPWLIADRLASRDHAVWLAPTPEFRRARLVERPGTEWKRSSDPPRALENRILREHAVGERIERDARERGLHVLSVDGSRGIPELASAIEEVFAEAIAAGPRATDPQARRALRRQENLQVHRQVSTFFERRARRRRPGADTGSFRMRVRRGRLRGGRAGDAGRSGARVRRRRERAARGPGAPGKKPS